jgi:hypothetical protein
LTLWRVLLEITPPAHIIPGISGRTFVVAIRRTNSTCVQVDKELEEEEKSLMQLFDEFARAARGDDEWRERHAQRRADADRRD